jgi:uncharacterized membrane protein
LTRHLREEKPVSETDDAAKARPQPFTPNENEVLDRLRSDQDKVTDQITSFAGSMRFVYLHAAWFGLWIAINAGLFGAALVFDKFPYGLLTMIVSLEAIFLSTFVMISQNRADARRQVFADQQYEMIQEEKKQNVELIEQGKRIEQLTQSVLALTQEVHASMKKT